MSLCFTAIIQNMSCCLLFFFFSVLHTYKNSVLFIQWRDFDINILSSFTKRTFRSEYSTAAKLVEQRMNYDVIYARNVLLFWTYHTWTYTPEKETEKRHLPFRSSVLPPTKFVWFHSRSHTLFRLSGAEIIFSYVLILYDHLFKNNIFIEKDNNETEKNAHSYILSWL